MKIARVLVDSLVEDSPETHVSCVVCKGGTKVPHVEALQAIHGILNGALLFYLKLKEDLEGIGFAFNPCDMCLGNCMINKKQHTLFSHG